MAPPQRCLLAVLLLGLWASLCSARFIVETHSIRVTAPTELKGTFDSSIANFGTPNYGGSLSGVVVFPSVDQDACTGFADGGYNFKTQAGQLPKIVLVDRGSCYFTKKVWDAQQAGASAVIVADDKDEPLITMDAPEDDPTADEYLGKITIPSALITKELADKLKAALAKKQLVQIVLDWSEAIAHPDERVEYEFWTNSNDECGQKCDAQAAFVKDFKAAAQILEQGQFTLFTPHYITWYCPDSYKDSLQCQLQCINSGRYCAPDPEQDFEQGYDGRDVVIENLRQLCVYREATAAKKPWVWWDYVSDFEIRCSMSAGQYNAECAEQVITSLGLDVKNIRNCVGDPTADVENPVLAAEQKAQVGDGERGDVTILPTVVINNRQYRGNLEKQSVLKAICSGFKETTEPAVCLGADVETNECLDNNGGCWQDTKLNVTACKDTFRGRVCECPVVNGVTFAGDGYTHCAPSGVGKCSLNNGGCWSMKDPHSSTVFTACREGVDHCVCPPGFRGDGVNCQDIDECAPDSNVCKCPECNCRNTIGSFECTCNAGKLYMRDHDTCIAASSESGSSKVGVIVTSVVVGSLVLAAAAGYLIYKYRLRQYMDSEIRAIMAQYMPLDSTQEQAGAQLVERDGSV
eukprot:TRINITY_DN110_c0_g1_i1.p1 TRINITY_DN110_c0_g1~~TRINITY_DN110_c0_g1_i1.p1  ORF type:complete len:634 (-),score=210.48 TRINITY_DN110_c0_g1_i1:256-2157(-)